MSIEKNDRGFSIYGKFLDERDCEIRVIESSAVGEPRAYVFSKNTGKAYGSKSIDDVPMYLTVQQAKELVKILELFIKDAEDPANWRNKPEYIATWKDQ